MQTTPSVKPAEAPKVEPLSPEELHALEMERRMELLAKVKVLREQQLHNRGMISGMQPDKSYIWVHQSDNRQVHFQGLGYELCVDPKVTSPWRHSDGSHRRGDLVLYQVDKDLHEALHLESALRGLEGVDGAKTGFEMQAHREGVRTFEPGRRS